MLTKADGGLITNSRDCDKASFRKMLVQFLVGISNDTRSFRICDSNKVVGVYFVTPAKKLKFLLLPTQTFAEDDGKEPVFLGNSSNCATKPRPVVVPADITGNCLIVAEEEKVPGVFTKGEPIDVTDPVFKDQNLDATKTYVLVKLPVCMPIPYGNLVATGPIDQPVLDCLEQIHPAASWWAEQLELFNQTLQAEILAKSEAFKKALPKSSKSQQWRDSPYVTADSPNYDVEDLEVAVQKLHDKLTAIANDNRVQAPPLVDLTIKTPAMITQTPSPTNYMPGTKEDLKRCSIKLMGIHYDPVNETVHLPTGTHFGRSILEGSSVTDQRQNMGLALENVERHMKDCRDFLFRRVEMPVPSQVVLGCMAQGIFHTTAVTSLTDVNLRGVGISCFLPDSHAASSKKMAADQTALYEDVVGESATKRTKLSLDIGIDTHFNKVDDCLIFFIKHSLLFTCVVQVGPLPHYLATCYRCAPRRKRWTSSHASVLRYQFSREADVKRNVGMAETVKRTSPPVALLYFFGYGMHF